MMKMLIRACLTSLALALPVQLHAGWDGIYAGLNLGRVSATYATDYEHVHIGDCINLNFGAEWPGEGCEGNQDYATSQGGTSAARTIGLSIERLYESGGRVMGWQANLESAEDPGLAISQVISTTWGDKLDFSVSSRGSLDLRFVYGIPNGDLLPYVSVGAGVERVSISFSQDQPGYDVPATGRTEDWTQRLVLGVGFKRDLGQGWVLGTELSVSRSGPAHLAAEGGIYSYGLRYPDTEINSTIEATALRIGLSRRF
jgi:opacity protein-like surface antigen